MSKVTKRKITVEASATKHIGSTSNNITNKDSQRRQSVFERLGTKTGATLAINTSSSIQGGSSGDTFCRHWAQNGTCPYGKTCSFASTHILISPSKRASKKEADSKQQVISRLLEDTAVAGLNKRLHSTVIKRGSPDVNWESWDQTDLEYEDEKVLEKRRQLLQRELELQMKRDETEEHHHSLGQRSRSRHTVTKDKKGVSSSSSTSVSSTSSTDSSSSSDDSSSGSSSSSGGGEASKRRKTKVKKQKRGSLSSGSDNDRSSKKLVKSSHKDSSTGTSSKKSISGRDKKPITPPRKTLSSTSKGTGRKKSISPPPRARPSTPPSKLKASGSKSFSGTSRHNQSPRSGNKRSVSVERKDKHNRSISPRTISRDRDRDRDRDKDRNTKSGGKDRSPPRRPDPSRLPRRKESPDSKSRSDPKRNVRKPSPKDIRSRPPEPRNDDRKKDDDRSRGGVKDDRRTDRKPVLDRDKRDHEDARSREKAREAAREKERVEALERCRERQREREQLAKEKERARERAREDRDKEAITKRDYEKDIPSLLSLTTHNPTDRKNSDRERDRAVSKDRKEREKDRDKERDRLYDRGVDKSDRNRLPEKDRPLEKTSDRDRSDKDRSRDKDRDRDRVRDKPERDRSFDRDRVYESRTVDRNYDRDKERPAKVIERPREREKERIYERPVDRARSYERDRVSLEKDRPVVRDRGLERVLERERNKSLERSRGSDSERSIEKGRDRFDREARYETRRPLPPEDKGYDSPYEARRERSRYPPENSDRVMYKDLSPSRDDIPRSSRMPQSFSDERRGRGGREVSSARGSWDSRSGFDDTAPSKSRDWDYPDSRRDWESRQRRPVDDWEGGSSHGIEADDWNRYPASGDWSGAGDWREEWPIRPSRHAPHPHRDEQAAGHIVSSNHIVVRDANIDDHVHEPSGRRAIHSVDAGDKESPIPDIKKEASDTGPTVEGGLKRSRDDMDPAVEVKKARMEEPPSAILEEALSDISDDADEILNREDVDITPPDTVASEEEVISRPTQSISQPTVLEPMDQSLLEDRTMEEEGMDNLDFEEISDEELEEEAKANRAGLGDALGVDWASLVAETRPRERSDLEAMPGAARKRWEPHRLLARIGVSLQYAGADMYNQIQQQISEKSENNKVKAEDETEEKEQVFLHTVATIHVALREKQAQRRALFCSSDTFKQALSARRDIAIRRQLCNLPAASLDVQQSAGFCQWVV